MSTVFSSHASQTLNLGCNVCPLCKQCVLNWKIAWHFLLNCISKIVLLLCKHALLFEFDIHSDTFLLCSSLLSVFIYTFLRHVGAKEVFAKTAFQIWQLHLQFYDHFLKFRKCFGQWFLLYSSQCFIVCIFYDWFLPINIFIKPLTTRNNSLFF